MFVIFPSLLTYETFRPGLKEQKPRAETTVFCSSELAGIE